ncbi:hypothetical protein ACJZ2D_008892 [Fusarium nematophilum]
MIVVAAPTTCTLVAVPACTHAALWGQPSLLHELSSTSANTSAISRMNPTATHIQFGKTPCPVGLGPGPESHMIPPVPHQNPPTWDQPPPSPLPLLSRTLELPADACSTTDTTKPENEGLVAALVGT